MKMEHFECCDICHQRDNIENWKFECDLFGYRYLSKTEIMRMISIACSLDNEEFWANLMRSLFRSYS